MVSATSPIYLGPDVCQRLHPVAVRGSLRRYQLKEWCRTKGGSCGGTIIPTGADDEVRVHIVPGAPKPGSSSNGEACFAWGLGLVDDASRLSSHDQARGRLSCVA